MLVINLLVSTAQRSNPESIALGTDVPSDLIGNKLPDGP